MNHPEFEDKIHPASATIVYGGVRLFDQSCPCESSSYEPPSNDGPTNVEDVLWTFSQGAIPHGTVVAGIAGALTENEIGIAGVCWDCSIMTIRITTMQLSIQQECQATFESCRASDQSLAASIRYAAGWSPGDDEEDPEEWGPVRARVICTALEAISGYNSAAFFCDEENPLNIAIDQAYARGCIIIAITGNSASTPQTPCWSDDYPDEPACTSASGGTATIHPLAWHPKTITVGGACRTGQGWHCHSRINPHINDLGSCGSGYYPLRPIDNTAPLLTVVAPIEDIVTTFAYDEATQQGAEYGFLDSYSAGTSWSSPQVAGVVALMLKMNPSLTFEQVKFILGTTATDIGPQGYDKWTGYGLLNAQEAVKYAMILAMPANFNGDEGINTLDPIDYLIAYGQGDVTADLDLDGQHTEADLAIFLNSYLAE